ncbi:lipopolysaccharide biosynthesis protein [Sporolactobacillus inulinus]|uniref:Lipopolysaccharide biosynthesis protein n=1 Tax=Sporolactobacillus inulinus TaxID=2078 RepID=A0A4Y1ZE63_9BACL|nr:oligosaccharide flippase family protein [Sporolactobacillus inulinus]GAY77452.1 lipopolysaccharide biosynthesis protein [Sporolactobacillus inulinus]
MKSFIKRLLAFSIGPFGAAFIGLITIPVTTHFVSPEEYGKASMYLLALTMLATVQYLGIDQAYTREFHEVNDREALFLNALLLPLLFALFILTMIALNLSTTAQLLFGEPDHAAAALLLGVSLVLLCFERFLLLSLRMQEKRLLIRFTRYSLSSSFLRLRLFSSSSSAATFLPWFIQLPSVRFSVIYSFCFV